MVSAQEFLQQVVLANEGKAARPTDSIIVTFGPGAVPATRSAVLPAGEVYASAHYTSQQDLEDSLGKTLIAMYDSDGDGVLDTEEVAELLQSMVREPLEDTSIDAVLDLCPDIASSSSSLGLDAKGIVSLLGSRRLPLLIPVSCCPICSLESDLSETILTHMPVCGHGIDDRLVRTEDGQDALGGLVVEQIAASGWASRVARRRKQASINILGERSGVLLVQDRESGEVMKEKLLRPVAVGLRVLYRWGFGRKASDTKRVRKMLRSMTNRYGRKYTSPRSKRVIPKFIEQFGVDTSEFAEPVTSFKTFNEFFIRHLKPGARPISKPGNPSVCVSPCDCRLVVYPDIDSSRKFWVKGEEFTIARLVNSSAVSEKYHGGAIAICRLAPQDYHRFHFPIDGVVGPTTDIPGEYYTVSPLAVRKNIDVFTKNKRMWNEVYSPEFGSVLYIAVGATMVGSIVQTSHVGAQVARGDEHGHFSFGGSTIILVFEPKKIVFDRDLILNSAKPLETFVKMGTRIGLTTRVHASTELETAS
eukprot:TRINITY_DN28384_c0_g1_i1.p1 TRINITY_DN28384_c0_g1~~TRINITY_DN28384_c0_g1_i1.p1  ORF type:complete len:557 (-),score=58.83 TRINITY_DN28384_c0_g1_i1:470-2062(-)